MVAFPNSKINFGLTILDKREDGFHNLQSIFLPVQWCDAIEIIEAEKDELFILGKKVDGDFENNSIYKALKLLRGARKFPFVNIHLLKIIPMGAGLGGGSSDGAFTLMLLNKKFNLGFSENELVRFAMQIGSDCAYFIYNKPMFVEGRGEKISPIEFSIKKYSIVVVFPEVHIDTTLAYNQLSAFRNKNKTEITVFSLEKFLQTKPENWKSSVFNDFEYVVFKIHPTIKIWKEYFYSHGALFSLMSGSGSSIFAIFEKNQNWEKTKIDLKRQKNIFISNF